VLESALAIGTETCWSEIIIIKLFDDVFGRLYIDEM
jgi:hypothetical protein